MSCAACLRRAHLLALCAGSLEVARKQRRPLRDVLSLGEDELLAALDVDDGAPLRAALERFDAGLLAAAAERAGLRTVCRHGAGYPEALRDDPGAPAALFMAGELGPALLSPLVAIVGTRKASPEGLDVARSLARGLAAAGVTVVSGMALGIDSAAHAGALEAAGATVAVLAGGADVPYPRSKAHLHERIAATGAVISEMPPGFRAFRWSFVARNRIIAGLADATIVVEAAARSGSLITAEMALELGRPVGAVPGSVRSWRSAGTNALLADGATLIRDARDVLDLLLGAEAAGTVAQRAASRPLPPPADLDAPLRALLSAVEDGRDTVAALAGDADGAATIRAGLMELELLGLVQRAPGGRVVRTFAGALG